MRIRRSRTTSALAALVTACALGVPAAAYAADADAAAAATAATAATTPTVTPAAAGAAAVVLPTGDRVTVHTGAVEGVATVQDPAGSDAFAHFTVGGDRYVVPSEAAPYVGRVLDMSLFDVTKLAAASNGRSADAGTHIPVSLRFAAGVTPTAPAGVTFTAVSGQTATGYLTPDSGHAFAQALRDAVKADLAAGRPAGTGALFGGLASMAQLGATPPIQPNYPLHILQVNALDDTGAAANLPIILVDADNARAFTANVFAYQGLARVAAPAGNYSAIALNFVFDSQAHTEKTELVVVDGITVPDTGTVPAATVDMRAATSPITFTTQQPATVAAESVNLVRTTAAGTFAGLGVSGGGAGLTTYVSPTPKPSVGSLEFDVNWVGQSPASAASPYRYNLAESSDHIAADQSYAPADSTLATLRHTVNLDPYYGSTPAYLGSGVVTPAVISITGLPTQRGTVTEYVTGGHQWVSELTLPSIPNPNSPFPPFAFMDDDVATYAAGQTAARIWAHAPIVPNFGHHPAKVFNSYGCQACAGAGNIIASVGMLGDSNPDTTGLDFSTVGTSQLYWNGQLLSSDTNHFGYLLKGVPGPGAMRMVFDYDRSASGITQSTKVHTDVTIPYSGEDDPSMTLPAGNFCAAAAESSTPDAPCQVLPALTLNYQLNALTGDNTSHSPIQNLVLHVGHLSYGSVGSKAPIDKVQVSVSYDNGATWQDVATHGAFGIYAAHWANPAAGSPVELKVTATDCLGGSITQTVTNPYTVG